MKQRDSIQWQPTRSRETCSWLLAAGCKEATTNQDCWDSKGVIQHRPLLLIRSGRGQTSTDADWWWVLLVTRVRLRSQATRRKIYY